MRGTIDDVLRGSNATGCQTLDLARFHLDDEGARKIAVFLSSAKCIKKLNLMWNEVWSEGARLLAQALATNTSLEVLDLSHNSIQTEGAEQFALALKSNKTLKSLNLCDNNINDAGVRSLLDSLEVNRTLVHLAIDGNQFFDRDLKTRIADRLHSNSLAKDESRANVTPPVPDLGPRLTQELEEFKAQNRNMKKSLEKLKNEHSTLKNRVAAQETTRQDVAAQLQASIQQRMELEKSIIDISTKLAREKAKSAELADVVKQRDALKIESQEAKDRASALNAERRTLRNHNEALTKRISLLTNTADYNNIELSELSELEDQLESTIKTIRTIKLQRLQRKLDEAMDSRKCKICFESAVNSVLMPCMHHILCEACSLKVVKCPVCNTMIQNRIHTYEC